MRYALAAALMLVGPVTATAQSTDPYAAGVAQVARERRQRRHDEFMQRINALAYAVGCHVVTENNAWAAIVYSYNAQARLLGLEQPNLTKEEMVSALKQGPIVAEAKGCDFWKDNPEAVVQFRQSVAVPRMP